MASLRTGRLARRFSKHRRRGRNGLAERRLSLEFLEDRRLLALVTWDGEGNNFDWNTAANWSTNALPGAADDVVISPGELITVSHSSGVTSVRSVKSTAHLQILGGTFTVAAASQVDGQFVLGAGATLRAEGPDASFVASATTAINGGNLHALDGGHIALPQAVAYTHNPTANDQTRTLRASGPGSVLDLSNVSHIAGGNRWNSDLVIEAAGGRPHRSRGPAANRGRADRRCAVTAAFP